MRNSRKSGQRLRSRKRPRRTQRSGRGSRTNSNTSHQIPARVIEADVLTNVCFLVKNTSGADLSSCCSLTQSGGRAAERVWLVRRLDMATTLDRPAKVIVLLFEY